MSLLIKGVEFPVECQSCPCCADVGSIVASDYFCTADDTAPDIDNIWEKLPNCPLVNVPTPHGRLIDADEVIKRIAKAFLDKPWGGMDFGCKIEEIIDSIPTVIEAELEVEDK